ncbi:hypothetical protein RFI_04084, partial [Reticulomyxa filosa]
KAFLLLKKASENIDQLKSRAMKQPLVYNRELQQEYAQKKQNLEASWHLWNLDDVVAWICMLDKSGRFHKYKEGLFKLRNLQEKDRQDPNGPLPSNKKNVTQQHITFKKKQKKSQFPQNANPIPQRSLSSNVLHTTTTASDNSSKATYFRRNVNTSSSHKTLESTHVGMEVVYLFNLFICLFVCLFVCLFPNHNEEKAEANSLKVIATSQTSATKTGSENAIDDEWYVNDEDLEFNLEQDTISPPVSLTKNKTESPMIDPSLCSTPVNSSVKVTAESTTDKASILDSTGNQNEIQTTQQILDDILDTIDTEIALDCDSSDFLFANASSASLNLSYSANPQTASAEDASMRTPRPSLATFVNNTYKSSANDQEQMARSNNNDYDMNTDDDYKGDDDNDNDNDNDDKRERIMAPLSSAQVTKAQRKNEEEKEEEIDNDDNEYGENRDEDDDDDNDNDNDDNDNDNDNDDEWDNNWSDSGPDEPLLDSINNTVLKMCGIRDNKDRRVIMYHIDQLRKKKQSKRSFIVSPMSSMFMTKGILNKVYTYNIYPSSQSDVEHDETSDNEKQLAIAIPSDDASSNSMSGRAKQSAKHQDRKFHSQVDKKKTEEERDKNDGKKEQPKLAKKASVDKAKQEKEEGTEEEEHDDDNDDDDDDHKDDDSPSKSKVPEEFLCPITHDIMKEPVICSDGFCYEREAIENWLIKNNTSPMTNQRLITVQLFPNHGLRSMIQDLSCICVMFCFVFDDKIKTLSSFGPRNYKNIHKENVPTSLIENKIYMTKRHEIKKLYINQMN